MHGIAVPFYLCNGSIKQQTYQLKLILSSILPPPIFWKYTTHLLRRIIK